MMCGLPGLLNLTNDAWFGNFAGPWQHLAIATSRTVEEGLPMVRAANTGISAVVDAHGRVQGWMGVGGSRVFSTRALPRPIPATPFARWGQSHSPDIGVGSGCSRIGFAASPGYGLTQRGSFLQNRAVRAMAFAGHH